MVAGSAPYAGAAVRAVAGALRGGAGAVRYVGPAAEAVLAHFPETLVHAGPPDKAGRVQSWVIGPGIGEESDRPVLLRVNFDEGHGLGSSRPQRESLMADYMSFILWQSGDPAFQPNTQVAGK